MSNKYFLLITALLLVECTAKKNICEVDIKTLTLVNKASYCYTGISSKKILNIREIESICLEINNLSNPIEDTYVNVNYGYINVLNSNRVLFSLIFSDYNGPIIRFKGNYYHSDKIKSKLMNQLELKLKEDTPTECNKF